jgi:hypothetical protein
VPTRRGVAEMDDLHEYYSVKRLHNKPIAAFAHDNERAARDYDPERRKCVLHLCFWGRLYIWCPS